MTLLLFFFFNATAPTEIYTLSPTRRSSDLGRPHAQARLRGKCLRGFRPASRPGVTKRRSEEHTSELQSHVNLVCRLLLEKKKITTSYLTATLAAAYQQRSSHQPPKPQLLPH